MLKKWLKQHLRDLFWSIYGVTVKNPKLPHTFRSLLFVCKGNICRSPFAERLAERINEKISINKDKTFYSAGFEVSRSVPSPETAIVAAEKFNVDLKAHVSRGFTYDMLELFDIIIVMEARHLRILKKTFPEFHNRFFLLPLFEKDTEGNGAFSRYNIPDPYGKPLDQFLTCFLRIEKCLKSFFNEASKKEQS